MLVYIEFRLMAEWVGMSHPILSCSNLSQFGTTLVYSSLRNSLPFGKLLLTQSRLYDKGFLDRRSVDPWGSQTSFKESMNCQWNYNRFYFEDRSINICRLISPNPLMLTISSLAFRDIIAFLRSFAVKNFTFHIVLFVAILTLCNHISCHLARY